VRTGTQLFERGSARAVANDDEAPLVTSSRVVREYRANCVDGSLTFFQPSHRDENGVVGARSGQRRESIGLESIEEHRGGKSARGVNGRGGRFAHCGGDVEVVGEKAQQWLGERERGTRTTAMKRRDRRGSVRPQHSPTNHRRERFVKVHDVGFEILHYEPGPTNRQWRQRERCSRAVRRQREEPPESLDRGGSVVDRVVAAVGRDNQYVVAPSDQFTTHRERLFLDPAKDAQGVGRNESYAHASHAPSKRGCSTCHCSGARRIKPSSSRATNWVTRVTSSRSRPSRTARMGGVITAKWSRPGPE
jgi:hypothetical protein